MSVNPSYLNEAFALRYFALSGGSLLVYDFLITFSSEVEHIWKTPWSVVKAGFLLHRYGNLIVQTVITLEEIGFLGPVSKQRNRTMCTYRVTMWLITLYTLYFLMLIGVACYFWKSGIANSVSVVSFFLTHTPRRLTVLLARLQWPLWVGIHNLYKSFAGFRSALSSPLIRLLIRDTFLFYAASVFNNGLSIICWSLFRQDPRVFLQLVFSYPLLTISGQRLVLNLRKLRAQPYTSSYPTRDPHIVSYQGRNGTTTGTLTNISDHRHSNPLALSVRTREDHKEDHFGPVVVLGMRLSTVRRQRSSSAGQRAMQRAKSDHADLRRPHA
ncbi:hypothetical protein V8E55_005287 [Tylopilus felleus]